MHIKQFILLFNRGGTEPSGVLADIWFLSHVFLLVLRELFFNLLHNAIRYTPQGKTITISLKRIDKCACVSIIDLGDGIPDEYKQHLFKRFYRIDKYRSRSEGELGLDCLSVSVLHKSTMGR